MSDERCTVCGGKADRREQRIETGRYTVEYHFDGACDRCVSILTRAYEGVTAMLIQGNEEERERALVRLLERLKRNGLDIDAPIPFAPPWFDQSIVGR